ncbi:tyrosine-type recombinase/integrase, partial [Enterococcus gallinarum]
ISPHGFRHSQATLLYELGVDPKDAQSRLRHKNLKTTMDIYTHISEARKRTPLTKLDEFSSRGTTSGTTSDQHSQNKS